MSETARTEAGAALPNEANSGYHGGYPFIFTNQEGSNEPWAYISDLPTDELAMFSGEAADFRSTLEDPWDMWLEGNCEKPKPSGIIYSDSSTSMYLSSIGKSPLLTAAGEEKLGRAIMAGQQLLLVPELHDSESSESMIILDTATKAWEYFTESNLRLVVGTIKEMGITPANMLQMISAGNRGVMRAATKFDHRQGLRFCTYATPWIQQEVTREKRKLGRGSQGPRLAGDLITLENDIRDYPQDQTLEAIAKRTNFKPERIIDLQAARRYSMMDSLDDLIGGGDITLGDLIEGEEPYAKKVISLELDGLPQMVAEAVQGLPRDISEVFSLYMANLTATGKDRMTPEFLKRYPFEQSTFSRKLRLAKQMLAHPSMGVVGYDVIEIDGTSDFGDAACLGQPVEMFFPTHYESAEAKERREAICGACAIRGACAKYGADTEKKAGIWGGIDLTKRRHRTKQKQADSQPAKAA